MSEDSDDDFARFLEEDDSASMSSASPVKKKVAKSKDWTRSSAKTAKKTSTKSDSGSKSLGGSLSALSAAEKLLASSGRAKSKAKPIVEEDGEEDEAPPPYSGDPYAFELGGTSSYFQDDDDSKDKKRGASRKSSSSKKAKSSSKAKRAKEEDDEEPPTKKQEAKPAKSLEERMAEILKRTGSTTALSNAQSESKHDSDEDDDGSDDADAKPGLARLEEASKAAEAPRADSSLDESEGAAGGHRLSFSDSLGMESADFEVGVHASRKLDRSRLSLSSLNSEKFAVNMDALEDSELVSYSRYDRPTEPFRASVDATDDRESEYGDEGFELDQTNDNFGGGDAPATEAQSSPITSEFEKMKRLFSLDTPENKPDEPAQAHAVAAPASAPDNETFGYNDEDFETDEAKEPLDGSNVNDTDDEYRDDGFEGEQNPTAATVELETSTGGFDSAAFPIDNTVFTFEAATVHNNGSAAAVLPVIAHEPEQLVINPIQDSSDHAVSKPPTPPQSSDQVSRHAPTSQRPPSPPMSPPPPPPPEEMEMPDVESSPTSLSAPVVTANPLRPEVSKLKNSVGRIRGIEQQVSALRFLRDSIPKSTWPPPSARGSSDDEYVISPSVVIANDAEIAEEMKDVEELVDQARRSRRERRRSSSHVRASAKEHELALRLQQAQRQLLHFKQHVQTLVDSDEASPDRSDRDSHEVPSMNRSDQREVNEDGQATKDVSALREENHRLVKELATQERLIQGFQRENEQVMKQLKKLQRDLHYDVHQENESLKHQLRELRAKQFDGDSTTGPDPQASGGNRVEYRAAIEARLKAEAIAASLQEDLNTQARRHQERVNELKLECEKLKKAKIEMECRYEGVDPEKIALESRQIKELTDKLTLQKTEHDHAITAMQKKIDWYVNNQRLLDEQDATVTTLKEEIKQLKGANEDLKVRPQSGASARSPAAPTKGTTRSPADIRRIHELESRLSAMEEAMRRRHPDSLVSLIVSSKKADEESKIDELQQQHEAELTSLTEEMEQREQLNEKRLVAFRQQQERLMLQYQKQIADLERQLSSSRMEKQPTGANRHAKKSAIPDDIELQRVRRFFTEKLKEVERKWEAKYRSLKKQHYAATGSDQPVPTDETTSTSDNTARVIRSLQSQLKAQDVELQRLRADCRGGGDVTRQYATQSDLRRRVTSLETQLKASEDARRYLVDTIASLHSITAPPAPPAPPQPATSATEDTDQLKQDFKDQIASARQEYEASLSTYCERIVVLEEQLADQVATTRSLRVQLEEAQHLVAGLKASLADADQIKRLLQHSEQRAATLESEVVLLRDRVASPQTPSMLQFRSLELRIETLMQKHQLREAELQVLLQQATQSSQLEKLHYERVFGNALALKNAEIVKFKQQLGELLDELEVLRTA